MNLFGKFLLKGNIHVLVTVQLEEILSVLEKATKQKFVALFLHVTILFSILSLQLFLR